MAMDAVWALDTFTFNGETYNETNGGPLDWNYADASNEIGDRVGGQIYVGNMLIPERDLQVVISMRDPFDAITPGTKSDIVMTLKKGDGSVDETITFKDMTFLHQRADARKSVPAESVLTFRYEAATPATALSVDPTRITRV